MESEDRAWKSEIAMRRCAKAALLLCHLKSLQRTTDEEMQKREFHELKIQLLKERSKINKIKLCALVELFVQLLLLLSIWTFFFVLFAKAFGTCERFYSTY
ncbi:hypothetical protein Lal_00024510 [Lupinus albus]|uniref:Uncharacterized protein n=1 Tax=Lupinus albus TaxID=3870 RepID=A0A6A4PW09_LUPAL|nr:hypothetical protein Lalb_Chr10g0102371 [Lupinus albus]KAF1889188.1 hypothetical protein Lal_00024510 [Lupinus albus]